MSIHFSERFDRNFEDDDWLDRHEAAQVLSQNSGHTVLPEFLSVLVQRDQLHPRLVKARRRLYQYKELRFLKVAPVGGRKLLDNPSPNAVRQREYRQRQALKKVG